MRSTETPCWPMPQPPAQAERDALSRRLKEMARDLLVPELDAVNARLREGWGGLA